MKLKPMQHRGSFDMEPQIYGKAVSGAELEVWLPDAGFKTDLLVLGGMHGDEAEGTKLLSTALRSIRQPDLKSAVILCANPDGMKRGTRGNLRGVDLNRNYPTADWQSKPQKFKWFSEKKREVAISPGAAPQSEPETRGLLKLLGKLNPRTVITIHSPIACIDDPDDSEIGRWLSKRTGLPHVRSMELPTPGSFGTWGLENNINIITWELPDRSTSGIRKQFEQITVDLLRHSF